MSEEMVIKHKTEVLPILRKLMPAKSEKTAKEEEKQAYIRALTECIQDAYEECSTPSKTLRMLIIRI